MATDQELEIIKKMDAADYVGYLRDSEGVESAWLLQYYRFCCYSRGLGVLRDLNAARAELLPVLNTYLSDENGESLGAAWYDLWMTPDGKVIRKTVFRDPKASSPENFVCDRFFKLRPACADRKMI